mmetsp:Transcript_10955/g.10586  ORF Transcript_10955/g.10586 Transcript_10955/m.10586 type:complete len:412 (-) Transcript_10955:38-1273(-)
MNNDSNISTPSPSGGKATTSFADIASQSASFSNQTRIPKFTGDAFTSLQHRPAPSSMMSDSSAVAFEVPPTIPLPLINGSGGKKRPVEDVDDSADDILGQICCKMNTLSTCDSNDDKIAAFISVLACSQEEAVFFLESAMWSVEEAVSLFLESGLGSGWGGVADLNYESHKRSRFIQKESIVYRSREVSIEGLPEPWTSWVSSSGKIYFENPDTGVSQYTVPPGFADESPLASSPTGFFGERINKDTDFMEEDEKDSQEKYEKYDDNGNGNGGGGGDRSSSSWRNMMIPATGEAGYIGYAGSGSDARSTDMGASSSSSGEKRGEKSSSAESSIDMDDHDGMKAEGIENLKNQVFLINNKHSNFSIFDANSTLNSPRITSNTPTNEDNPAYNPNEDPNINENYDNDNGMGSS